jgi:hypothetical protein
MTTEKEIKDTFCPLIEGINEMKSLISDSSFIDFGIGAKTTYRIKLFVTKIFALGNDAVFICRANTPAILFGCWLLNSRPVKWLQNHTFIKPENIWSALWPAYGWVVRVISKSISTYWALWLWHYLRTDRDYQATILRMARNPMVPLDLVNFYRILVYGDSHLYGMVKGNTISFGLTDEYRDRQIRNGMAPQF